MRLATTRLDLVPLDLDRDLADLYEMFADPLWAEAAYCAPARDLADSRARLTREFADNGGLTWVLRLRPAERAVGVVGVFSDQGTPIRGLSWYLRRDQWGRGLMSEAVVEVVDHLLTLPHIDGVEAWIDSRNTRSIGVARRARLDLVGRLPRVYDGETAQSVVMARAAQPADPLVIGIRPVLHVSDVAGVADLLVNVLGLQLHFQFGEPEVEFARLRTTRWSDSNAVDLRRSTGEVQAVHLALDVGVPVDSLHDAVAAAGCAIMAAPADMPWYRREFGFRLEDGHLVTVSGPTRPPGE
jgi:RimJ/RimL family protein N-acetyltransferase